MISQDENGDQSATTRSAIGAGGITITNGANQTQDVASLSRDTTNTNGTVSNTPDVENILSQQADTMQAAQAAGQVVAQGIGAYADMKRNVALASGDQATADAWDEGGTDRVALHVVGGALMGWLGGGSVFSTVGGAAGAGVSAAFAGKLNSLADSIGDGTGSMTLGNVVANVLAEYGRCAGRWQRAGRSLHRMPICTIEAPGTARVRVARVASFWIDLGRCEAEVRADEYARSS